MKKNKKRILAYSLAFVLATSLTSDTYRKAEDRIFIVEEIDNPHYIGSCFEGNVFIGTENEMKALMKKGVEGIFVIDERNDKDPNVQIIDSYNIKDKRTMEDVLTIIKQYDDAHPSKWSRTIKSMINEWVMHNLCYATDFYICNSKDVDLNNADEEVFKGFNVYKLILRKQELDK